MDIGCGKGFMLYDLKKTLPGLNLTGIDISRYAIKNAHPKIKKKRFCFKCKKNFLLKTKVLILLFQ